MSVPTGGPAVLFLSVRLARNNSLPSANALSYQSEEKSFKIMLDLGWIGETRSSMSWTCLHSGAKQKGWCFFRRLILLWSDRHFAFRVRIHGAECCGANPPKLELIRSLLPCFSLTKQKNCHCLTWLMKCCTMPNSPCWDSSWGMLEYKRWCWLTEKGQTDIVTHMTNIWNKVFWRIYCAKEVSFHT